MSGGIFGGVGKLEIAPFNGPDDLFPTWVDVTVFVRTEETPLSITRGRQNELDTIQSSQLTCLLDDTDDRFTPGYTAGPYGSGFVVSMPVRYSETIGQRTFILFTGYLEAPDVQDWQPIGYHEVALSAVDRLTRFGRTTPFVSTLGAHIVGSVRNNALVAYWPLLDAAPPFLAAAGSVASLTATPDGIPSPAKVTPSGGLTIPGDDQPSALFVIGNNPTAGPTTAALVADVTGIAIAPGQVLTAVIWVNIDPAVYGAQIPEPLAIGLMLTPGSVLAQVTLDISLDSGGIGPGHHWSANYAGPGGFLELDAPDGSGSAAPRWYLTAIRWGYSPNVLEVWVDGSRTTGTFADVLSAVSVPIALTSWGGSAAHMQVYVGAASDFTFADFAAQRQVGLTGLEWQTTGQRINQILDYAGVPDGLRLVDPGRSFMAPAAMAGSTVEDQLELTDATEVGRAFMSGDGKYVFQDRAHVLNV